MRTIAFVNQKGGVAKTSTCFHLAAPLADAGLRVLLVDNDPQSSLTQGFLGPAAAGKIDPAATVAALYEPDAEPDPAAVLLPVLPGVSLLPGAVGVDLHNTPDRSLWPDREWNMRRFLGEAASNHDICLIDCPPNLLLCSWAALLASDAAVVPLQAEDFGSQGLAPVARAVADAARRNPGLRLGGYLLTMYDKRLAVHQTYEGMLRERYGDLVLRSAIPRAKDFVEAVASRKPVGRYKPKSAAAKAVKALADEIVAAAEQGGREVAA